MLTHGVAIHFLHYSFQLTKSLVATQCAHRMHIWTWLCRSKEYTCHAVISNMMNEWERRLACPFVLFVAMEKSRRQHDECMSAHPVHRDSKHTVKFPSGRWRWIGAGFKAFWAEPILVQPVAPIDWSTSPKDGHHFEDIIIIKSSREADTGYHHRYTIRTEWKTANNNTINCRPTWRSACLTFTWPSACLN